MWTLLRIIAILLILLLLVGAGVYFFYFLEERSAKTGQTEVKKEDTILPIGSSREESADNEEPTASAPAEALLLPTLTKSKIAVNDFRGQEDVAPTKSAGVYTLFAPKNEKGDTLYAALYFEEDSSFLLTLFEEPLGKYRKEAESKLVSFLGIPKEAACLLRYGVYVSKYASEFLAGENLGFSFCTGAVALPD